jgi:hypothetical protein
MTSPRETAAGIAGDATMLKDNLVRLIEPMRALALGTDKPKSALSRNPTGVRISGACWDGLSLSPTLNDT